MDPDIRIVPYDPSWPAAFEREAAALREALGPVALRIDHVGSTSVPGLAAKPIIDLQISVAAIEPMAPYRLPLEALGYLFVPDPEMPDYPFFARPPERPRTHHIHVCQSGSAQERRHLGFRDYLRAHPSEARAYEALKRELAARHPGDLVAYLAGKDPFIKATMRRAAEWASRPGA